MASNPSREVEQAMRAVALVTAVQADCLDAAPVYDLIQTGAEESRHGVPGLQHLAVALIASRAKDALAGPLGELLGFTPAVHAVLGVAAVLATAATMRPKKSRPRHVDRTGSPS